MQVSRPQNGPSSGPSVSLVLTVVCLIYLLLLVYSSLMPFDFALDWTSARERLRHAGDSWPFGEWPLRGRADIVSNVLVYVPLGFLVGTRLGRRRGRTGLSGILAGVLLCGIVSAGVEFAQAFCPERYASTTDLLMNASGGLVGAAVGSLFGVRLWGRLAGGVARWYRLRPLLPVALLMMTMLAADALFPLWPTTDLGQVKHAIRDSEWTLSSGFPVHPWHHWVVNRVCLYAVLTALLAGALGRRGMRRWALAALVVTAFLVLGEAGKLLMVSRHANVANVATGCLGILLGLLGGALFARGLSPQVLAGAAAVLVAGYLTYGALSPWEFDFDTARLSTKLPRGTRWIPLYHYAMGSPKRAAESVRLFVRLLLLTGAFSWSLKAAAGSRPSCRGVWAWLWPALAAGFLLSLLEFMQVFVAASRVPSTTDVLCAVMGALLGVWVYRHYPMSARGVPHLDSPPRPVATGGGT